MTHYLVGHIAIRDRERYAQLCSHKGRRQTAAFYDDV